MIEIESLDKVDSINEKASDPSTYLPVVIPPPIPEFDYTDYGAIRDELLVEMDGIVDPFEQMMFALMVLMPTILTMQEQDLSSLGHTQSVVSLYGEKLEEVQTYYNEMKNSYSGTGDMTQAKESAENMYVAVVQLQQYLELDTVLDSGTRAAFKEEVDAFVGQFTTYIDQGPQYGVSGWKAIVTAFNKVWDTPALSTPGHEDPELPGHDIYYEEKIDAIQKHRDNLSMFQMGASSLSAESQVVNALVDYDAQHYNDTTALLNDMFEQYYKQVQANIKNYMIQ